MKSLFLAVLLALVRISALAVTYYVDPNTGNDSNSGTSTSSPWAHIPGTVTASPNIVLQSGDLCVVKGGSINNVQVAIQNNHYNGAAVFDSIVIQSGHLANPQWGTGRAVIDGQLVRTYGVGFDGVYGVSLDGFEIRNIAAGINAWGGNGSAGIEYGANSSNGASYVRIRHCYIHDTLRSADDQGHGLEADHGDHLIVSESQIGPGIGTKGIEPYHVQWGAISNNFIVVGGGDHGVALTGATNFDICNNTIMATTNGAHNPVYCVAIAGGQYNDIWNNIIYENSGLAFVSGNDWPMGIGLYAHVSGALALENRIFQNTLYRLSAQGNGGASTAVALGGDDNGPITNTMIMNNLVEGCSNLTGGLQYIVYVDDSKNENVRFSDFFYTASGQSVMSWRVTGQPATVSTVASFSPGSGSYSNNQELDAVFSGGSLPNGLDANYHPNQPYFDLTASSPSAVKNTGNALVGDSVHGYSHAQGKFSIDILGNTRSLWSMGAYEFGGTNGTSGGGSGGTEIADTFTDVNNTPLQNHATTTGGYNWVPVDQEFHIFSGQAVSTSEPSGVARYYVNHTMSSNNYTATININNNSAGCDESSLGIRDNGAPSASRSAYFVTWLPDVGIVRMYKVVNGAVTQLGPGLVVSSCTSLSIQASGTTISGSANGMQFAIVADSDIPGPGFVGIGSGYRGGRDDFNIGYYNLTVTVP